MPDVDDPDLHHLAAALRADGELVINALSGAPDPRCDRHLVDEDGQWRVLPLDGRDG